MRIDFARIDWASKLAAVGIDRRCLTKKAGPCPLCFEQNGKHWFRFDDKGGLGTWFCQSCGAGNGFSLMKKYSGMEDWELMKMLNDGASSVGDAPIKRFCFQEEEFSVAKVARNRAALDKAWSAAVPISEASPVGTYLQRRVPGCDLARLSGAVRFHEGMEFYEEEGVADRVVLRGTFPVMLAKATDAANNPVTLHRTYLTVAGEKAPFDMVKKQMKGVRKLNGAAIRLCNVPDSRTLAVVEGYETGLAVATASRYTINVWSLLNCGNMALADIPAGRFDKVIIFADHDRMDVKKGYRPGEHHAMILKARLEELGYEVIVKIPLVEGTDFADVWLQMQQAAKQPQLGSPRPGTKSSTSAVHSHIHHTVQNSRMTGAQHA